MLTATALHAVDDGNALLDTEPIDALFRAMCELKASDLHLSVGSPPAVRKDGRMQPLKEGAAPLGYMVEGGAVIRVRDLAGNRDLSQAFVPGRSIVRVDARRGVIYGEHVAFAGPLPENGRYQVIVEPGGENVARQGTFQPTPRGAR